MIKLQLLLEDKYAEKLKVYDRIDAYIKEFIGKCPGNNQDEKVKYAWKHYPDKMQKLVNALTHINKLKTFGKYSTADANKASFDAEKYYIRFGDFPKNGKSYNFLYNEPEIGMSAYEVKWNVQKDKWEIVEDNLNGEGYASLYELADNVLNQSNPRPVYLVQGSPMLEDLGNDGEAMLDINNIKVIKKLQPHEYFSKELGDNWEVDLKG